MLVSTACSLPKFAEYLVAFKCIKITYLSTSVMVVAVKHADFNVGMLSVKVHLFIKKKKSFKLASCLCAFSLSWRENLMYSVVYLSVF